MINIKEEIRKQNEEFEKSDNSIGGIICNLSYISDETNEIGKKSEVIIIAETLLKLPKNVREKVLQEVIFIWCSSYGVCQRFFLNELIDLGDKRVKRIEKNKIVCPIEKTFILLNFQIQKNKEMKDTIAHEIAHFILGHNKPDKITNYTNEKKADDLTEKWGFKRAYTNKQLKNLNKRGKIK